MNLAAKIAYNTIVQFAGKIISTILGLISLALMARYLGQSGFGDYTTVINFVSFFAIIADLGLTLVTVQIISNPNNNEKDSLNNLMGLRLISILLILGISPIIGFFLPYSNEVKIGILIATLSFVFPALNQIIIGLLQKKLRMDKAVIAETVSRLVLVGGVLLVIKLNSGLSGILWASVIAAALNFLTAYFLATKFYFIKPTINWPFWKSIIKVSWPLAVTIVLNLLYLKTDTLILSLVKSSGEVGLYGAAYRIIDVLTTLPFMFAGIILPILTSSWLENKKEYFSLVLQKSFDLMAIFAIPLITGFLVLAHPLMILVAGEEFSGSALILKILIFALVAIFLGCMFAHAVIALDKQKKMIGAYIFVSVSSVILYLIFIPTFSYLGAAAITIYSEVMIALFSAYIVFKYSGFLPKLKIIKKTIIASLVLWLFLNLINPSFYYTWFGLIISGVSAILVYFISLYFLKGITINDLKILLNKKN